MEKSGLTTSFLLIVFLVSLFQSSNGSALIRQSCMTASKNNPGVNYNFCVSFLEANVKTEPPNITVLTVSTLKLLNSTAANIFSEIAKLLKDPKFSENAKSCLNDCSTLYDDAMTEIEDAERYVETKDFAGANIRVSAAMDASTTCEDQFGEAEEKSPLTNDNSRYYQIGVISLVFVEMCRAAA